MPINIDKVQKYAFISMNLDVPFWHQEPSQTIQWSALCPDRKRDSVVIWTAKSSKKEAMEQNIQSLHDVPIPCDRKHTIICTGLIK